MELGSKSDPLVVLYAERLEALKASGMLEDEQLEELTGGLLVLKGLMQVAEEPIRAGYERAMVMTCDEFAKLEPTEQEFLRSLVAERLYYRPYALVWLGCTDDWIAVVGPSSEPVTVGRGKSDTWPSVEKLAALSAANNQLQVWILERPDRKI